MREKKEKSEKSLAERLCERLDIPPAIALGGHKVEILGREALCVSGCKKIILYAPCEIRLALSDSVLCVVGRDLVCVAYSPTELSIEGRIDNLLFKEA